MAVQSHSSLYLNHSAVYDLSPIYPKVKNKGMEFTKYYCLSFLKYDQDLHQIYTLLHLALKCCHQTY